MGLYGSKSAEEIMVVSSSKTLEGWKNGAAQMINEAELIERPAEAKQKAFRLFKENASVEREVRKRTVCYDGSPSNLTVRTEGNSAAQWIEEIDGKRELKADYVHTADLDNVLCLQKTDPFVVPSVGIIVRKYRACSH